MRSLVITGITFSLFVFVGISQPSTITINQNAARNAGKKQVEIGPKQDEPLLALKNCEIELFNNAGEKLATKRNDSQGKFLFTNVPEGDLYVRVTLPDGKQILFNSELQIIQSFQKPRPSPVSQPGTLNTKKATSSTTYGIIIETGDIATSVNGSSSKDVEQKVKDILIHKKLTKAIVVQFQVNSNSLGIVVQGGKSPIIVIGG